MGAPTLREGLVASANAAADANGSEGARRAHHALYRQWMDSYGPSDSRPSTGRASAPVHYFEDYAAFLHNEPRSSALPC